MNSISKSILSVREVGEKKVLVQWVVVIIAALSLAGCAKGAISSIELDPAQTFVCDTSVNPNVCGVSRNQPVKLIVRGKDQCPVYVRCGKGSGMSGPDSSGGHDFGQPPSDTPFNVVCHYDTAWPGPKTVRAYSNGSTCIGEATLKINVMAVTASHVRADSTMAYGQPLPNACNEVPGVTAQLRPNTRVSLKPGNPNAKMNFGCLYAGCEYDADGEPGSSAPNSFPFPSLRKYSLVLRVGTQVVQGGRNMNFITTGYGPLEFCVNDELLSDNSNAWGIIVSVDESQAPFK